MDSMPQYDTDVAFAEGVKNRIKKDPKTNRGKVTRKLSAQFPVRDTTIFHYTALRLRRQSSIFSLPRLGRKQLLLLSFLLCSAMGKMNRSTYQLNAYTSDWGERGWTGREP
jgi:hypothetical protein